MGTRKIILIDDEVNFAANVQSYFKIHGYDFIVASNGQQGLELIERERPELMILDILMPSMDGYTMLRELKRKKIDIKCIIITAKGRLKDLFELERVDRFLTKPFDLNKLKDIVDELLGPEENISEKTAISMNNKSCDEEKKKVLLIDDEKKLTNNIKQYLEAKGYSVKSAFTGTEGLALLRQEIPDIIITDIMMPNMDGYSMIKEFRRDNGRVPIIAISAKDKLKDLVMMEGISAFIAKPFDLDELMNKIEQILGNSGTSLDS